VLLRLLDQSVHSSQIVVRIGNENLHEGLQSTSVVTSGYGVADRRWARSRARPRRMDYAHTMARVAAVAATSVTSSPTRSAHRSVHLALDTRDCSTLTMKELPVAETVATTTRCSAYAETPRAEEIKRAYRKTGPRTAPRRQPDRPSRSGSGGHAPTKCSPIPRSGASSTSR